MPARPAANRLLRELWYRKEAARLRMGGGAFEFEGQRLPFFYHRYNRTWNNERQVEVPIALRFLRGRDPSRTLEVGNVLSHYRRVRHTVVDRYERAPGVHNEDFLRHSPAAPYKTLVSISTFEHIGFDEPDHDAHKFRQALRHAQALLAPGGSLFFTTPLGHNPVVDEFSQTPPPGFTTRFLQRQDPAPGHWAVVPHLTAAEAPYDRQRGSATGILVAWMTTASRPDGLG